MKQLEFREISSGATTGSQSSGFKFIALSIIPLTLDCDTYDNYNLMRKHRYKESDTTYLLILGLFN